MEPGLYYGKNAPEVAERGGRLAVALVFPGKESLATSTLGWQVVYRLLSDHGGFSVERFFYDARNTEPPISADSDATLDDFPAILFSVNFEEDYLSVVKALQAADIPLRSTERDGYPLLACGGPVTFLNPAPLAPVMDFFFTGEAEQGLVPILSELASHVLGGGSKDEFLDRIADEQGIYAPARTKAPAKRQVHAPAGPVLTAPAYSCFISGTAEFADMLLLEVNRGCPYGCRFCAAGYVYRPPRHARMEELMTIVEHANPRKVGLVGTALTDWPDLRVFLDWLGERKTKFSLSSIRADGVDEDFLTFLRDKGLRTLTMALEAPSKRLRDAANKKLNEKDLLDVVRLASELRYNHLKLYCIIGWPGETDQDYDELEAFMEQVQIARDEGRGKRKKGLGLVTLSVFPLVPKPWTPFQWAQMAQEHHLDEVSERVRKLSRKYRGFKVDIGSVFSARLQALLARGGEDVFEFVRLAAEQGSWRKAFKVWDGDVNAVLHGERNKDDIFPWDIIDIGLTREYLWRQWQAYSKSRQSAPCPAEGCDSCQACGIPDWLDSKTSLE